MPSQQTELLTIKQKKNNENKDFESLEKGRL